MPVSGRKVLPRRQTRQKPDAPQYAPAGRKQPVARLTPGYNNRFRVAIVLNAFNGEITYLQRDRLNVPQQVHLLEEVRQRYAWARVIYYIQDNWHNVHFNPVQEAAAERLGIRLIPLPTYAPWLNPTE